MNIALPTTETVFEPKSATNSGPIVIQDLNLRNIVASMLSTVLDWNKTNTRSGIFLAHGPPNPTLVSDLMAAGMQSSETENETDGGGGKTDGEHGDDGGKKKGGKKDGEAGSSSSSGSGSTGLESLLTRLSKNDS